MKVSFIKKKKKIVSYHINMPLLQKSLMTQEIILWHLNTANRYLNTNLATEI